MSTYKRDLQEFSLEEADLVVDLRDFDFGDVIGKGGFGEVNRAIQKSTGRDCAVKQIFSERLEGTRLRRYLGEIKTMAKCHNMFLVPFVGFTSEPPYSIVTEYMPNGALDNYIRHRTSETLSGTQLTAIAIGIAYGMIHLHSLGIIHRDLKAANILLDSYLYPRICDFGIARFEDQGAAGMTAKIGTPNYMAPELITSKDYDRKVDVYAYAMILYEMAENQRPFKGLKVNDIFQQVVQRDNRPQFTRATPPNLQKLIRKCWDRDPEIRPTFEEIFQEFADGKVAFPDTRRYEISKLLQVIQKTEARNGAKSTIPAQVPKGKVSSTDTYTYSDTPNPPHGKYIEEIDIESESNTSSDSETSDHADEVLRNSQSPLFFKYLDYYAKTIEPSQFNPFYSPISTHIKANATGQVLNAVLGACYLLMQRNGAFIQLFAATRFFTNLPVQNDEATDRIVDCFSMLFVHYPKALGQQHCGQLSVLLEKRPEKMLVLHSYYVKQLLQLTNPWPVLDNLFTVQRAILMKGHGHLFLSLFHYLIKKYDVYAKERAVHVRGVFLQFLNARDAPTVCAAYNGLADLYDDVTGLDFTRVTQNLNDDSIWEPCLSLLIRLKRVNPSRELVRALLARAAVSPKPWIVILNIASSKRGADFLLKNDGWMDEAGRHPKEVCRVFLVLFKAPETREMAVDLPGFPALLRALLATGDPHMHSAVTSIVRRSPQTKALLSRLHAGGVLKAYVDETLKNGSSKRYTNALAFFDALSRIAYSPSFLLFVQPLTDLLSSQAHASDAVTVIVSFSFYRECAAEFRERRELMTYFRGLEKCESFASAARTFIRNVEKA